VTGEEARYPRAVGESAVTSCRIVELPVIRDVRGNLTFVEGSRHIPFEIQRVYYLYDVPGGQLRAGHAHLELEQLMIAASGSFDVEITDGRTTEVHPLNRPYLGLYVPPMVWRDLTNFSSGAVCLVLASAPFDEADYIRDFDEFIASTKS
jgi:dTDP-4-dehydrorhamnose 3,5-epimerase-like enzyme